jgi:hypothetical protein
MPRSVTCCGWLLLKTLELLSDALLLLLPLLLPAVAHS